MNPLTKGFLRVDNPDTHPEYWDLLDSKELIRLGDIYRGEKTWDYMTCAIGTPANQIIRRYYRRKVGIDCLRAYLVKKDRGKTKLRRL